MFFKKKKSKILSALCEHVYKYVVQNRVVVLFTERLDKDPRSADVRIPLTAA